RPRAAPPRVGSCWARGGGGGGGEPVAAGRANQGIEVIANVRGREIDPSDDAPNEIRTCGELEELTGLVFAGNRLHEHGSRDALSRELRSQVIRGERPPDRVHGVSDHPWIRGSRWIPKVVMRVDACGDFFH